MQERKNSILADQSAQKLSRPRRLPLFSAVAIVSLLGVVTAAAVTPNSKDVSTFASKPVVENLAVPFVETVPAESSLPFVYNESIRPGDTLQTIFSRLGVQDAEAWKFMNSDADARKVLSQLRADRSLTAMVTPDGQLVSLNLPLAGGNKRFIAQRSEDGFVVAGNEDIVQTQVEMREGTINHSLFGATDAAGVPDSVANRFAEIFGTQIDFSRDIRSGDRFSVVYETEYEAGIPVRTGRILAAEFTNRGETHLVLLYRDKDGNENYFTQDGRALNQAYLRYPLEFTRVSSNFGKRLHPIHKSWRNHNGTDFAAPSGTPVKASSDGTVKSVGTQRGYGKTIVLQHRNGYSTLYAHLNGFAKGLRNGQRVRQGDLIGYVGMTGWATGPHLHYEIRINNVPHDPMKIALPPVEPLEGEAMVAFKEATLPMLDRLALLKHQPTRLAAAKQQ